jgi:hypothetical protein
MEVTGDDAKLVKLRRDHATTRDHTQANLRIDFCADIYIGGCFDERTLNVFLEYIQSLGEFYRW